MRELSRIAKPHTEAAWAAEADGKNLREIETLVAGHRPGELRSDPPDPEVRTHVVRFEVSAETFAVLRQARSVLDSEHGTNLTDDAFLAMLAGGVVDGTTSAPDAAAEAPPVDVDAVGVIAASALRAASDGEVHAERARVPNRHEATSGRARLQIALTVCARCRAGWQHGGGAMIPISSAAIERAECDAQHLGAIDAEVPQRAYRDISPAVARLVWLRDEGRCQTPGCRSSRGLEIHHVVPRSSGGHHGPSNLRLHCSACHAAQHAGTLAISGQREAYRPADAGEGEADVVKPCARTAIDHAIVRAQAKDALVGLGWRPGIARAAVDEAIAALGVGAELEPVIREALRRCPKPA